MKKILILAIVLSSFIPSMVNGQQYTLFSHYNFEHFFHNPAAAGNKDAFTGNLMYRNQWSGFEGAPVTQFLTLHGPFRYSPFSLGGQIYNDQAGDLNNFKLQVAPAYRFDAGQGKFSIGLGMNVQRLALDAGSAVILNPNDPIVNDYMDGIWNFYITPGIYYNSDNFYAGLSVPQPFEGHNTLNSVASNPEVSGRHALALIGFDYQINDRWAINPSFMGRIEQAAPFNFDVNTSITYDNTVWLNLGYRSSRMFMVGLGFNINEMFRLGYTYDAGLNPLGNLKARGSHEILAGFTLEPKLDSDNDGIIDKLDKCPNEKGVAKFNGCPPPPPPSDRDKDGIIDSEDKCPDEFGLKANDGCPKVAPPSDRDGDGVIDIEDNCPDQFGLARLNGCPDVKPVVVDTDGDGIIDAEDRCPNTYGVRSNGGCPEPRPVIIDTDGDGIADTDDRCPNTYGAASNGGCPQYIDSDGDGVADDQDRCPNTYGSSTNFGCPLVIDSDGDGLADNEDRCPNTYGPVSNGGCPRVTVQEQQIITRAFENLTFETGSAVIRTSSYLSLNDLASYLVQNPSYRLRIAGHTDNVGDDARNLELSRKRAEAVRDYIAGRGVSYSNMIVEYYGETMPIYDNSTADGRKKNRRVEFEILY